MTDYVVGLAFDTDGVRVALIHKQTGPACVLDRWNGVGGKIDPGELPHQAMEREFREETGVSIPAKAWHGMGQLVDLEQGYRVHFFFTRHDDVLQVRTQTSEVVRLFWVENIPWRDTMHNLAWMIPLALDGDLVHPSFGVLTMSRR